MELPGMGNKRQHAGSGSGLEEGNKHGIQSWETQARAWSNLLLRLSEVAPEQMETKAICTRSGRLKMG